MELSHYLDFSDQLDTIILVLIKSLDMFDGNNLARLVACSSVHLTKAALAYHFMDLVVL